MISLQEKAGNEIKKLSYGLCFKARPLPDFYKERETPVNQMKKVNMPFNSLLYNYVLQLLLQMLSLSNTSLPSHLLP